MSDNRETTIEDVRYMCRRGAFRAYTKGEDIYLEDSFTRETVKLNGEGEREQTESEPTRPTTALRAGEKRTPHGGRTARMFGSEPRPRHEFRDEEGPYKGFLMVKCEECGKIKAFCARRETYGFRCDECGAETPLEKLRPMHLQCKCGSRFNYKTNLTEKYVTHTCISCHAPVDMELNRRETAYVTIEERG
jgi:ribosomal protein S27E